MEFVQPLRSLASIDRMKKVLRQRNIRDYTLFILGIYTGLRISDLLKLKVEDVSFRLGPKLVIRDQLALRERKTGKAKIIILNKEARSALRSFLTNGLLRARIRSSFRRSREKVISLSRSEGGRLTTS